MREGLPLLKEIEGCKLKAYLDGGGVPTIGYGETLGVKLGMVVSQEWADLHVQARYDQFEADVKKLVKVPLTPNELGALVCFTYNVGVEAFTKSTMLKLINARASAEVVAAQFDRWKYDNGKVVPGLENRRNKEKALFLQKS